MAIDNKIKAYGAIDSQLYLPRAFSSFLWP